MNNKINIGGILFDNITLTEAIEIIEKKIKQYKNGKTSPVFLSNQDIINKSRSIKGLDIGYLNKAFLILPDGYSILYASKILRKPLKERVAGPDLMLEMIKKSNIKGYKNYFLGAKEGIARKMIDNFLITNTKLKISGIYSPPFGDFTHEENEKIIKMINKAKPDILWVSFGCPKQEKWILDNMNKIKVPVSLGIGAAFDFHSGNIKRAPLFIQKLRLEWFYRFLQEPKRLFGRYFIGGFEFIRIILKQKFFKI